MTSAVLSCFHRPSAVHEYPLVFLSRHVFAGPGLDCLPLAVMLLNRLYRSFTTVRFAVRFAVQL